MDTCDPGLGCQHKNICVGWHTVAVVPAAFTQQPAGAATMSLTFGQPASGVQECDSSTVHFGFGPVSIVQ